MYTHSYPTYSKSIISLAQYDRSMVQPSIPQHLLSSQFHHLQHPAQQLLGSEEVGTRKGLRRQLQRQALGRAQRKWWT